MGVEMNGDVKDLAKDVVKAAVAQFIEELGSPPSVAEVIEIIKWALPHGVTNVEEYPWPAALGVTPTLSDAESQSRVEELNDATFVDTTSAISLLAGAHARAIGGPATLAWLLEALSAAISSADVEYSGQAPPSTLRLKADRATRVKRLKVGDIVAIPVGASRYRFAVVVFEQMPSWDTGLGLLTGESARPQPPHADVRAALPWVIFTDEKGVASGKWIHVASMPSLASLFPDTRTLYHPKKPFLQDEDMGLFGLVEYPNGLLRKVDEDEAAAVGMLDGTYYSGGMSESVEAWIATLSEAESGERIILT